MKESPEHGQRPAGDSGTMVVTVPRYPDIPDLLRALARLLGKLS